MRQRLGPKPWRMKKFIDEPDSQERWPWTLPVLPEASISWPTDPTFHAPWPNMVARSRKWTEYSTSSVRLLRSLRIQTAESMPTGATWKLRDALTKRPGLYLARN